MTRLSCCSDPDCKLQRFTVRCYGYKHDLLVLLQRPGCKLQRVAILCFLPILLAQSTVHDNGP